MKIPKKILWIALIIILLGFVLLYYYTKETNKFIPLDEYNNRYSNELHSN